MGFLNNGLLISPHGQAPPDGWYTLVLVFTITVTILEPGDHHSGAPSGPVPHAGPALTGLTVGESLVRHHNYDTVYLGPVSSTQGTGRALIGQWVCYS